MSWQSSTGKHYALNDMAAVNNHAIAVSMTQDDLAGQHVFTG